MKFFAIALLASLTHFSFAEKPNNALSRTAMPTQTPAILCADQADNRIRLVNPLIQNNDRATLWSYPAADEKPIEYRPADTKRVAIKNEVFILAAYHGRVRLVHFRDSKLIKDNSTYKSCHSAKLLPDGSIGRVDKFWNETIRGQFETKSRLST